MLRFSTRILHFIRLNNGLTVIYVSCMEPSPETLPSLDLQKISSPSPAYRRPIFLNPRPAAPAQLDNSLTSSSWPASLSRQEHVQFVSPEIITE